MTRASDLPELVFLIGAPRSGTTWLQLLLAQSPQIATVNETHLFNNHLRSFFHSWRTLKTNARPIGLSPLLADAEIEALIGGLADQVIARIAATRPDASHVLEKTPDHVRYGRDILRIYPDARFVHVVRDPRSVVASLQAAAGDWGTDAWSLPGPFGNAQRWRRDVLAARALASATAHCLEVRYEDLYQDGDAALARVLGFIGIDADAATRAVWLDACRIERLRAAAAGTAAGTWPWRLDLEPEGFFRHGGNVWAEELSAGEIATVEAVAGDLMEGFGYARVASARRAWPRTWLHALLERAETRLHRWRNRL